MFILKDDADHESMTVTKVIFPNPPILLLPEGQKNALPSRIHSSFLLISNNLTGVRKTKNRPLVSYTYLMI
jgi:hypothetical protein